jgi:hypothetical protein
MVTKECCDALDNESAPTSHGGLEFQRRRARIWLYVTPTEGRTVLNRFFSKFFRKSFRSLFLVTHALRRVNYWNSNVLEWQQGHEVDNLVHAKYFKDARDTWGTNLTMT